METAKHVEKRSPQSLETGEPTSIGWSDDSQLVGLVLEVQPYKSDYLYAQYTVGLHAWFLDQVRQIDPELSAYLHDSESEKPFTISGLDGLSTSLSGKGWQLSANQTYRWYITALSARVVQWVAKWLTVLPSEVGLRSAPLKISKVAIAHQPTTYTQLFQASQRQTVTLSFITPTSFRRKGNHFPLPVPVNVFHSYLRRWNDFSEIPFDQEAFLAWVDEFVIIHRHKIESVKVAAGKKGSVTGFTGSIEFGLSRTTGEPQFEQLFYTLVQLAPYCGTGHKTTFGLGQTRLGWLSAQEIVETPNLASELAQRIAELTEVFLAQRQRTGGNRAREMAETLATILARRELGESLQNIAQDLDMPYETVKTYAKLARRGVGEAERAGQAGGASIL